MGRTTTRAVFSEMIAAARDGTSEVEALAAVPLAVAFLLNCVLNVSECNDNSDTADKLCENIRELTRELGDGAHKCSTTTSAHCH